MSKKLSLHVEPVLGADINDVFADASSLANKLGLAWVSFDFNDGECTAYPDYRGHVYRGGKIAGQWTADRGIQWA